MTSDSEAPADGAEPAPAPERRRSRWWLRLIAVVTVLAVLFGLGELAVRMLVPGIVASAVRQKLELTADHAVDVSLGGSALLNVVQGRLGDVTVDVADVPVMDGISVSASLHAASIPFDFGGKPISGGTVELTVPKDQIGPIVELATKGIASTGKVSDGVLEVGRKVELFGQKVPVTATVSLGVKDGDLTLQPRGVSAAGFDLSAKELRRLTGPALNAVLKPQTICVRDRIPAGVTLTSLVLSSTGSVRVAADLAPTILTDPEMRKTGSCV